MSESLDRIAAIRAAMAPMLRKLPADWHGWSADEARLFRSQVDQLHRAKRLDHVEQAARQLAGRYGLAWPGLTPAGVAIQRARQALDEAQGADQVAEAEARMREANDGGDAAHGFFSALGRVLGR